jgi:cytosine/adenosine deaminase-related metal-dependent hydrolase
VESVPELMPDMWNATPLRVVSFRELIGLKGGAAAQEMVGKAVREWAELADRRMNRLEACSTSGRLEARPTMGLSPHAPYSTTPDLLRGAAEASRELHWRLMTHVAESDEEVDMFKHRKGPLFDWLQSQRDMSDCGGISPVQCLERCGVLGENSLAVHANYLEPEDIDLLAARNVSVVHCPRSHDYFGHRAFPYGELAAAGVNICLGTDSLVSVLKTSKAPRELSLFAEMQTMASRRPELPPATLLRMATIGGAAALGRRGDLGQLSPDALADLIVIPYSGSLEGAEQATVHFEGKPARVMIGGKWQE